MSLENKKLGDLASFINGKAFKPDEWKTEGLPIIRIQNLTNLNKEFNYFDGNIENKYLVKNGDILISWSATLDIFEWHRGDAVLNQHIFKVVFDKLDIDRNFFKYLIKTKIKEIENYSHGATMKHIIKSDFDNINILLPSLENQKKIASILDKADEVRQKNKTIISKYNELTQSLFIDIFGEPVTNSKNLKKVLLNTLASKISSGSTPKGGESVYQRSGYLFIRSQNVRDNKVDYKNIYFIDDKIHNSMKRTWVKKYDVLLNITGASIGRTAIFYGDDYTANVNQHVAIIRLIENKIIPIYLLYHLTQKNYQKKIIGANSGGTREAFNFQQIKEFEILLPPIELQKKFADQVELIEKQKALAEESLKESEELFNSLLDKAFKGELII